MQKNKGKKYLVTTNIEETWFKDEKIFFLGPWCKDFENEEKISKLNHIFHTHHWQHNNEKLSKDNNYIKDLTNRLIGYIKDDLKINQNLQLKQEFWKISTEYWLMSFITIAYDKWETLKSFLNEDEQYVTKIVNYKKNDFIPTGLENYYRLRHLDIFHHYIFSEILKYFKYKKNYSIEILKVDHNYLDQINQKHFKKFNILSHKIKLNLINIFNIFYQFLCANNNYCIFDRYQNKLENLKLNLSLNQLPILFLYRDLGKKKNFTRENIKLFSKDFEYKNDFESFISSFLPQIIPFSFVEELKNYITKIKKSYLPKSPKTIFATNIVTNTFLSIYCGLKKDESSKIIFAQHGGSYGQHLIVPQEYFERKVSDKFLTWGWDCKDDKKVTQFCYLKKNNDKLVNYQNNRKLLLINRVQKKYITDIDPYSSSIDKSEYFVGQKNFLNTLDENLKKEVIIRYKALDYMKQKIFDKRNFPNLKIDEGETDINELFKTSKVVVSQAIQTTYLESLSLNIPTIVFTHHKSELFRDDFLPYLKRLKDNKIFFDDAIEAARHLNKNWADIDNWWKNNKTQEIVLDFSNKYIFRNKNRLQDKKNVLLNI
tara:strand:- start:2618 stop:4411 length:1794 start_codon:yes stop_codon:yes gene_type:complete